MNKKKYGYIVIALMLVIAFVVYTKFNIIDEVIFEPKPIENASPCEIMDLTPNGYENNKLVNDCLNSIS